MSIKFRYFTDVFTRYSLISHSEGKKLITRRKCRTFPVLEYRIASFFVYGDFLAGRFRQRRSRRETTTMTRRLRRLRRWRRRAVSKFLTGNRCLSAIVLSGGCHGRLCKLVTTCAARYNVGGMWAGPFYPLGIISVVSRTCESNLYNTPQLCITSEKWQKCDR